MSKQKVFDSLDILGVEVDIATIDDAITNILESSAPDQPAAYVVKPYVEFLDQSYHNLELRELLDEAALCLADGIAIVWAAAYLYAGPRTTWRFIKTLCQIVVSPQALLYPLSERGAGINFTSKLLEKAATSNRRVAIVGSPVHQSISNTATTLRQVYPNLQIVSAHDGWDSNRLADRQSNAWLQDLIADLVKSRPDIILLGLGFPRQEFAAAYLASHMSHGVFIGEGGSFDYKGFGGKLTKAPQAIQKSGLEWLWRLILEPRRWRRQLAIPRFIWRIWRSRRQ